MKVVVFIAESNGAYPVPAVRGGAIATLIENIVKENCREKLFELEVVSYFDPESEKESRLYSGISFRWIKIPKLIKLMDKALFFLIQKFFKRIKAVSFKSFFSLLFYILKSSILLKQTNYDKVVIENTVLLAWIIKLSKYKGNYYYHFHNVPRIDAKCRREFHNSKAIFCVSKFVANQICRKESAIGMIEKERARVFYNCIDEEIFRCQEDERILEKCAKKYGIDRTKKVIAYVGRLSKEKGIDQFIRAVEYIKSSNIQILIVGSYFYSESIRDEYQDQLHQMAEQLEDRVIFTGYISQRELPAIYSLAYLSVLPSMWEEPAGLTMVESLACGTPVITTQSGGIPEYMGDSAILLQRNEDLPRQIAEAIDEFIEDPDKYEYYKNNGLIHVKQHFTKEVYLAKFKELLAEDH